MLTIRFIYLFLCYFCLVLAGNPSTRNRLKRGVQADWSYSGDNGPSSWGGVCQTGKKQSPINIQLGSVIVKEFPSFHFGEHYLTKHKFIARNNGHTIHVDLEDKSIQPVIYGGGLGSKFIFEQLHLHWESEHEFEGKRADLEMHMVHYNAKYGSFEKASTQPDGIAVLAVIYNKSNETDGLTEKFFEYILDASTTDGHSSHPIAPGNSVAENENRPEKLETFALRDLLPKYVSRFFRYDGSLTTPNCGEVVQWTIFINRLPVSGAVLNAVRTFRDHDGNLLNNTFRPPKKLNGRDVYIQIKNDEGYGSEFQQMTQNGCSKNGLLSIKVLYCCLFTLYKISNYKMI